MKKKEGEGEILKKEEEAEIERNNECKKNGGWREMRKRKK